MRKLMCFFLLCTFWSIVAHGGQIIGHLNVDEVAAIPQSTMDMVASQSWYFAHASVGGNIIGGLNALMQAHPDRYQLSIYAVDDFASPPADPQDGVVYDNYRGNPDWQDKILWFEDAVRNLDWREPNVNVAMNKLCYIDAYADAETYLNSMSSLANEFPETQFVYTTIPLTTAETMGSVLRANFNQLVREYCENNGCILFDLADIESHDPDGNPVTFTFDGVQYPLLYEGYTVDGGHLNASGAERVALGWYAVAAAIAGDVTSSVDTPGVLPVIANVYPNPFNPATIIQLHYPESCHSTVSIFDLKGRRVYNLWSGITDAGSQELTWRGVDSNGRALNSGVFLVRVKAMGHTFCQKISLTR